MRYYSINTVDLFINVSSSEGVPVSIMEAMSFGIPVIATAVGGTPEIVSEKTGWLIEPGISRQELAAKISAIAGRDDLELIRKAARDEWFIKSRAETIYEPFVQFLLSV
jgi:glycosyltransferase involved in cell wall biosynthesis